LRTIDANGFNWQIWAVASSGFFTDSYNLFVINVIFPSIAYVYWPNESTGGARESNINIITFAGSMFGQLLFGYLADRYGRTQLYGIELLLVIFSTIGVATSSAGFSTISVPTSYGGWKGSSMSFAAMLYSWRVVTGIGIGAGHPLNAVIDWHRYRRRISTKCCYYG
jgi:PHS family inorganic phosphate transporter-like MFS transporter